MSIKATYQAICLIIIALSLTYIAEAYQCNQASSNIADEIFNRVDNVGIQLSNTTLQTAVLRKYTIFTISGEKRKVGIYSVGDTSTGLLNKVRYIYHSGTFGTAPITTTTDALGTEIIFFDSVDYVSAVYVEANGGEFKEIRPKTPTGSTTADQFTVTTYSMVLDANGDFYPATGTNQIDATDYVFKKLIAASDTASVSLWQATSSKYYLFQSDLTKMRILKIINVPMGSQVTCSNQFICYSYSPDTNVSAFYKIDQSTSLQYSYVHAGSVPIQISNIQFIDLKDQNHNSIGQMLWSSNSDKSIITRLVFQAKDGSPALVKDFSETGLNPLKKYSIGYNNQFAEYQGSRIFFIMGWTLSTSNAKNILKFSSAGEVALQEKISSGVLQITFNHDPVSKVIILTKNSIVQLLIRPINSTTAAASDPVKDNDLSWGAKSLAASDNTIEIYEDNTISLSDKTEEMVNRPFNHLFIVIRNQCVCIEHSVKDISCFNDFHCVVSIDYNESNCSDYSASGV